MKFAGRYRAGASALYAAVAKSTVQIGKIVNAVALPLSYTFDQRCNRSFEEMDTASSEGRIQRG
jgi:hypothetical protein